MTVGKPLCNLRKARPVLIPQPPNVKKAVRHLLQSKMTEIISITMCMAGASLCTLGYICGYLSSKYLVFKALKTMKAANRPFSGCTLPVRI